ncbi:hypothetical protein GGX14DRAFT_401021 [Mycena pura]|uniref:Uncharacterized protein n=1 Tax=Mycena pura TaxID=153505 RepID=A0AAD6Y5A9_9AGAR|nr:hypothetical protein GGX14DRAFT_401021 [Mycena pura]
MEQQVRGPESPSIQTRNHDGRVRQSGAGGAEPHATRVSASRRARRRRRSHMRRLHGGRPQNTVAAKFSGADRGVMPREIAVRISMAGNADAATCNMALVQFNLATVRTSNGEIWGARLRQQDNPSEPHYEQFLRWYTTSTTHSRKEWFTVVKTTDGRIVATMTWFPKFSPGIQYNYKDKTTLLMKIGGVDYTWVLLGGEQGGDLWLGQEHLVSITRGITLVTITVTRNALAWHLIVPSVITALMLFRGTRIQ